MIYVAVHSGLRVSGGDWSVTKAEENSATVASEIIQDLTLSSDLRHTKTPSKRFFRKPAASRDCVRQTPLQAKVLGQIGTELVYRGSIVVENMVELVGIEPTTPWVQTMASTNLCRWRACT